MATDDGLHGVERTTESPLDEETDERAARADWRSSIVGSLGLILVIGLWLVLSPAILEYERPALAILCGIAIMVVAVLRMLGSPVSRSLAMISAGAGVVTVIAAFAASESAGPTANLAVMGAAVIILSLIGVAAATEAGTPSHA